MSDYISREAAIEKIRVAAGCAECNGNSGASFSCNFCDVYNAIRLIKRLPAADMEPVRQHGQWMHEETEGGFHVWSCSRCGRGMNGNPKGTDLYCYHCGAKMDLEDENHDN